MQVSGLIDVTVEALETSCQPDVTRTGGQPVILRDLCGQRREHLRRLETAAVAVPLRSVTGRCLGWYSCSNAQRTVTVGLLANPGMEGTEGVARRDPRR